MYLCRFVSLSLFYEQVQISWTENRIMWLHRLPCILYKPINLTLFRVYVIEEFDDLFDDALKDIADAPLIGVKLEGPRIKRGGCLFDFAEL